MHITLIYGKFSSQIHGAFNIDGLYRTQALTGSESSFFNLAWALTEAGHRVEVYCDCDRVYPNHYVGTVHPLTEGVPGGCDAYIAWNEPDLLRTLPRTGARLVDQQLNDFTYCSTSFSSQFDYIVSPSRFHRDFLVRASGIPENRWRIIPNSCNPEFYEKKPHLVRKPHSIVWTSSPDRGLHRLLEMFPLVRQLVPDATLHIYYRILEWMERTRDFTDQVGMRSRYIAEAFRRLGTKGENGVFLVDAVSNMELADRLQEAALLVYPCEPVIFTEGFSVTILDACAAGCIPVISDADAIGDIYEGNAIVIPGNPGDNLYGWVKEVVRNLRYPSLVHRENLRVFARDFSRERVARKWVKLINETNQEKRDLGAIVTPAEPPIDLDDPPEAMSAEVALRLGLRLWKRLLLHDEVILARQLLDSLPFDVRQDRLVKKARARTSTMLAHLDDPASYRALYSDYSYVAECAPLPGPITGFEMKPRYDFVVDMLGKLQGEDGCPLMVLDVGCIDGWLANRLARDQHHTVFGVDASHGAIALARAAAEKWSTGAEFHRGFFGEDPLPPSWPEQFHAVVALEIYEHLAEPLPFLRKLADALRPGGLLLLSTPHGSWFRGRQVHIHEYWNSEIPREHVRAPIPDEIAAELRVAGLTDIKIAIVEMGGTTQGQGSILVQARKRP